MKLLRDNKGFTLIEIILTLAIIALVIPLASNMMIQSFNIFNSGVYRMNTGQRVELALEEISKHLRSATSKPIKDDTATLKTYKFDNYISSEADGSITIELNGNNANDYNLLLNDRIIAENVTDFSIDSTDDIYTVNIEYRIRERESDSSVKRTKSLEVYPKNLN